MLQTSMLIVLQFISSYCSRQNISCCKHSHLLYQTIEKEVKSLHDTAYSLSLVPEGLHHVANIDTYCIKSWEKWVLRNLPSKYLEILSRDDFVSM